MNNKQIHNNTPNTLSLVGIGLIAVAIASIFIYNPSRDILGFIIIVTVDIGAVMIALGESIRRNGDTWKLAFKHAFGLISDDELYNIVKAK